MVQKSVWGFYLDTLTEIYHLLQQSKCLYSLNDYFNQKGKPNGYLRGVWALSDDEICQIKPMLEDAKRLYEVSTDDTNRHGLPINFPKFLDDETVFKMQIHVNVAHQSKNYESGSMISVASVRTIKLEDDNEEDFERNIELFRQAESDLTALGYDVLIENLELYDVMFIDVKKICELYKCSSVQKRVNTGRQIRADLFSHDDDGLIQESKLKSVGVLLVPQSQNLMVVNSHKRKIRKDSLYVENHPKEIIIKHIPEHLTNCRFYRK